MVRLGGHAAPLTLATARPATTNAGRAAPVDAPHREHQPRPLVTAVAAAITIGIGPTIEVGLVTIAWHALTIALGGLALAFDASRRGLDPERMYTGD